MALTAVALASTLAVAGCSGGSEKTSPGDRGPDAQSTAAGSTLLGQWPLTGKPANGPRPKHPVMVVKIDNTSSSSPQVGLSKADLVTEELVEGGATRLAVFYYSRLPKVVGPVRSFRASDIGVVKPVHGVLVASGGAPPTVRRVKQAGIRTVTEGGPGFYRDSGRTAPYNLFDHLPQLAATLRSHRTPDSYLPWGEEGDLPSGKRARGLAAEFSAGHTTSWRYKGGHYVNLNSNAPSGDQYRPDTVLVLRVKVGDAGYKDPAGNPVPEMHFTGRGDAMVFHGGKVVRGTWSKKGYAAPLALHRKGGELTVPPGHVWIELVPAKTGDVSVSR